MKRDKFPWRTVLAGMALQVTIAAILIPKTIFGEWVYTIADQSAQNILAFAREGTHLVFGALSENKMMQDTFNEPTRPSCWASPFAAPSFWLPSFPACFITSAFYKNNRARHGVGDAAHHAHQRQRKPLQRRQRLHGPNRSATGHQALPHRHDPQRNL